MMFHHVVHVPNLDLVYSCDLVIWLCRMHVVLLAFRLAMLHLTYVLVFAVHDLVFA